jgi:hypothetical protein
MVTHNAINNSNQQGGVVYMALRPKVPHFVCVIYCYAYAYAVYTRYHAYDTRMQSQNIRCGTSLVAAQVLRGEAPSWQQGQLDGGGSGGDG